MATDPITSKCRRDFTAAHHSGSRQPTDIRHVVIHSTEGSTAAGAASWFANPASQGSTQLIVDPDVCFRTLDDLLIPWGAKGANTTGVHVEMAAKAAWPWRVWMNKRNRRMVRRAAFKTAQACRRYGLPRKWLKPRHIAAGESGIITHANVNKAFPSTGHTDPGKGFPRRYFMRKVRKYHRAMK